MPGPRTSGRKFLIAVTYQFVYHCDPALADILPIEILPQELILAGDGRIEMSGKGGQFVLELTFDMEAMPATVLPPVPSLTSFDNHSRELLHSTAWSTPELLSFASTLPGIPIAVLASAHSQFTQNLTQVKLLIRTKKRISLNFRGKKIFFKYFCLLKVDKQQREVYGIQYN